MPSENIIYIVTFPLGSSTIHALFNAPILRKIYRFYGTTYPCFQVQRGQMYVQKTTLANPVPKCTRYQNASKCVYPEH
jgi:hypothetical protein